MSISHDWTAVYRKSVNDDPESGMSPAGEGRDPVSMPTDPTAMSADWMKYLSGCSHDHRAEQRVFDMPSTQKLACCAVYNRLGNAFNSEGAHSFAFERYNRSLTYYEYCFPSNTEEEIAVGLSRLRALLNQSSSSLKCGQWPETCDILHQATRMIREIRELTPSSKCTTVTDVAEVSAESAVLEGVENGNEVSIGRMLEASEAKIAYRYAIAHRHLHEYDSATSYIKKALEFDPEDAAVRRELHLIRAWKAAAARRERDIARRMFTSGTITDTITDATTAATSINESHHCNDDGGDEGCSVGYDIDLDDVASVISAQGEEEGLQSSQQLFT